jgi:hypothetical protein
VKPDFDRMTESELLRYANDKLEESAKHSRRALWGFALIGIGLALQLVALILR